MFDVGFWELAVIGVTALVVVGPERLPGLARTAGRYVGDAQRILQRVRLEFENEMAAEEYRQHHAALERRMRELQQPIDAVTDALAESTPAAPTDALQDRPAVDPAHARDTAH